MNRPNYDCVNTLINLVDNKVAKKKITHQGLLKYFVLVYELLANCLNNSTDITNSNKW